MTSADKDNVIICSETEGGNAVLCSRPMIRKRNSGFTPSGYGKKKPRHNSVGSAASEKLKECCTDAIVSSGPNNNSHTHCVAINAKAQNH